MFKTADKSELNQISLTGMRAIVLLGLLIIAPRSFEEIKRAFIDLNIHEATSSDDILRIDINTLKVMGCEISRASAKTNFKYVLGKHPFALKLTMEEIPVLKRIYNRIKEESGMKTLIEYDELFKKISTYICDNEVKEALLGISILKYHETDMIKNLYSDCQNKRTLELIYKKTATEKETKKEIIAQELVFKNDKIYLYGYDTEKQESVVLLAKRIKSILSRKITKSDIEPKVSNIKFVLKYYNDYELEENETLIDNTEDGYIIEGHYHNDFLATQRMLSLGSRCIVLEPIEFRNNIIEKLKEMRRIYE